MTGSGGPDESELGSLLRASDRLACLGSLASGIAHSVNNPLTTVLLNLALLERELAALAPERQDRAREHLYSAKAAVERVRAEIQHLRVMSRWRREPESVDVRKLLDSVIAVVESATPPSIQIHRDYTPVPLVRGRETDLGHAFLALLRNALPALPMDTSPASTISIRTSTSADGQAIVEISDPGTGIAPADLPHIFDPLYTSRDPSSHSGIGLAVCRAIIQGMNGTLEVACPANPTTLRVALPAEAAADSGP